MSNKTISVKVRTGAKASSITEDEKGIVRVSVHAQPINGAANEELIKILAYYYKIPRSSIIIKSGKNSRQKIITLETN